jgi:hypothetical protein
VNCSGALRALNALTQGQFTAFSRPAPYKDLVCVRTERWISPSLTGPSIRRRVGDAYFELNGEGGASPVIFGEEDDKPLLGATTLESIGLVLDPFKRRLIPMRMSNNSICRCRKRRGSFRRQFTSVGSAGISSAELLTPTSFQSHGLPER